MFWHSTKHEIEVWLDHKVKEFVQEENKGPQLTPGEWLGRYVYYDIHEIFFSEFSIPLYEWLARLEGQRKIFQGGEPTEWTPELIR